MTNRLFPIPCFFLLCSILILGSSCKTEPQQSKKADAAQTAFSINAHLRSEPDGLNPLTVKTLAGLQLNNLLFSTLIQYDPITLQAKPVLVKALPVLQKTADGLLASTYTIHDKASWDNGTAITGHDVAFTLKALLNPHVKSEAVRPYFGSVKGIEIGEDDPKNFTILSDHYFMTAEMFANLPILPAYHYDVKGLLKNIQLKDLIASLQGNIPADLDSTLVKFASEFNAAPFSREPSGVMGSGAYALSEWTTGERIVLKRKENWWGDALVENYPILSAYPSEIIYKIIPDYAAAITAMKDGQLDVMHSVPSVDFMALQQSDFAKEKLAFGTPPSLVIDYISINTKKSQLADKNLRRALAHLVDYKQIIATVMNGFAERISGPFHPSKPYYDKSLPLVDFDIEKAKTMLAQTGWMDSNKNGTVDKMINGKKTELVLDYLCTKGNGEKIATLIQEDAKKAGVGINVQVLEFKVLREKLSKRDYDLSGGAMGQEPGLDNPEQLWHSKSDTPEGMNRSGFGNSASDKIIDAIQTTQDAGERNALYKEFQKMVYEEQPFIFLAAPLGRIVYNNNFTLEPSARLPGVFENMMRPKH
jgi:peptide/nickel transport system substrate-binding protein